MQFVRLRVHHFVLASLVALPLLAATVPVGTELQLRLKTEVSSDKPSGQPVSAVVIAPVLVGNAIVIDFGTELSGVTADAHANKPAEDGNAEEPATLRIQMNKIRDNKGQSQDLSCVLRGVDNARESVDESGLIKGIEASQTFTALADQGVNKIAEKYEGLGQLLSTVKGAIVKQADPAIDYKPGVEFTVKLTKQLDWNPSTPPKPIAAIGSIDTLTSLVASLPYRTVALKPPAPSDLTNLLLIGSKEEIEAAFKDAGWFPADPQGRASTYHTAQAIIENRGYDEAPMSVLTLNGTPPDLTYEKQNNTFASRHHIRLWQMQQTFAGKPVFVAAATHDIKIYFSRTSRSITHGIDPDIDNERTKVVNDMLFTGRAQATALIERTNIPKDISNATGDQLKTDDKIAAVEFKGD